jgi:lipopolysaccharide/colanic/teichoic acid biosynthesis glycosyltransferase
MTVIRVQMTDATDGEAAKPQRGIGSAPPSRFRRHDPRTAIAGASRSATRASQPGTGEEAWPVLRQRTRRRVFELRIKRVLDVVLSLVGLIVLSPVLLGAAIAIAATTPGPVLLRQTRGGLHGKRFGMLKFRTMHVEHADPSGQAQTRPDDERVTPVGRVLRRTSIDELPQLVNVILGDMSLVGPRPHVEGMLAGGVPYEELVPYYSLRQVMRPGLSGWAQANGLRGPTDSADFARARIDYDIAYIQQFSIWLDLRIIWMTVMKEFVTGSGV